MFEKHIDALFQRNFALFENNEEKIKFSEIFAEQQLSPYLLTYFRAEIKWVIFKEKVNIQSHLGADAGSNEEMLAFFKKKLFNKLVIYKDDLKERMYYATKIYFNFLIRPIFTYEKFIFDNDFAKPLEEIERKIEYLHGYDNLKEVVNNYLQCLQEEIESPIISAENFMEVINDADVAFFSEVDAFDLFEYLTPIIECFTNEESKVSVPIEALLLFFDDKKNIEIYDFILKQKKEKNLSLLDEDHIQILINDIALLITEANQTDEEEFDETEENADFYIPEITANDQDNDNADEITAAQEVQDEITIEDSETDNETEDEIENDDEEDGFDDLLDDMETEPSDEDGGEVTGDENNEEIATTTEPASEEESAPEDEVPAEEKKDDTPPEADLIAMAESILQGL